MKTCDLLRQNEDEDGFNQTNLNMFSAFEATFCSLF